MKTIVYGSGAVGARTARQIVSTDANGEVVLIDDDLAAAEEVASSLGSSAKPAVIGAIRQDTRLHRFADIAESADVVILTAAEDHVELARTALLQRMHVISVSDDLETVRELLELNDLAEDSNKTLVVGAGFSPGLTCLLARHAGSWLDVVDEIHVAKFGTGGPQCARQHHKSLRTDGIEWRNQQWEKRRGGTGRELCWFPDPVGGLDCFQGALPEPLLLLPAFPNLVRSTARVSATRRDMSTKWLPMLRRPHPEGMIGAVRVEVRGWKETSREVAVVGALDRPAVAAGTIAAICAQWARSDRFKKYGAGGLAELVDDPVPMLHELAERGVKAAIFEGSRSSI
jgi:hypothetical protein